MAEAKPVTIQSITVKERVSEKGPYNLFTLKTTDGEEYVLFGTKDSQHPRINKKEVELKAGDTVQIILERSGKNVKVLEAAVIKSGNSSQVAQITTSVSETGSIPAQGQTSIKAISTSLNTAMPTSKDLSMELSGLIQALISTGHYHDIKPGVSKEGNAVSNTFINTNLLEMHVKRILETKDKLAQERAA